MKAQGGAVRSRERYLRDRLKLRGEAGLDSGEARPCSGDN